jgi:hypothetical protein
MQPAIARKYQQYAKCMRSPLNAFQVSQLILPAHATALGLHQVALGGRWAWLTVLERPLKATKQHVCSVERRYGVVLLLLLLLQFRT